MTLTKTASPGFIRRVILAGWNLIQIFIALYGLGCIAYLAARLAVGERWNVVAFADNFVPWWALFGLISAAAALLSRFRWILLALQLPMLGAFIVLYGNLFWPPSTAAGDNDGLNLTIATYNMFVYSDSLRAMQTILDLDADVIGLQEVGIKRQPVVAKMMHDQYPYQVFCTAEGEEELGLLSRYPVVEFQDCGGTMHFRAVLDIKGERVAVYVAHFYPPKSLLAPVGYDSAQRRTTLAHLQTDLERESGPVLLLCDCNMTDQSRDYHTLNRLLDDSFREAGWGLGFTFPARIKGGPTKFPLLLRIDYIWHNRAFGVDSIHVWKESGTSDHHPVIAHLVLQREKTSP
jgi:vancomycin resistance protein VanJ